MVKRIIREFARVVNRMHARSRGEPAHATGAPVDRTSCAVTRVFRADSADGAQ
jgi:hypothetical protein